MNIFEKTINDWTASVLTKEYKYEAKGTLEITHLIEHPKNLELGDYALPCFSFSKTLRRSPAVVASELAEKLQKYILPNAPFIQIQASGPYLNFTVSSSAVAEVVLPDIFHGNYFKEPSSKKREKVMIEYSQPNTHKGFHVGHLRNVTIGDSLCLSVIIGMQLLASARLRCMPLSQRAQVAYFLIDVVIAPCAGVGDLLLPLLDGKH